MSYADWNMHSIMLTCMQHACDMTGDAMCIITCMLHISNVTGDATCILTCMQHAMNIRHLHVLLCIIAIIMSHILIFAGHVQ